MLVKSMQAALSAIRAKGVNMTDKNKQRMRIAEFITDNGSITGKEASDLLGIMSFTKRISEMNKKGYPLDYVWEKGKNRYGEPCRYKRWFLIED